MYRGLWLAMRGRRDAVTADTAGFDYAKGTLALPLAFGIAGILEAAVVHFLVPWPWLRVVLLVLTVYSLVWIFGMFAARVVNPHLLTADSLILRYGDHVVARIPLSDITAVRDVRRYTHTFPIAEDERVFLASADGTNVDLELAGPIEVMLPGFGSPNKRRTTTTRFSLFVTTPEAFSGRLGSLTR